ncbi:MAG: hypothetical protein NC489_29390 [Ruminococcus flavefaciens]|nr:hypothetical protein [Ruminococcus flavefaciens]
MKEGLEKLILHFDGEIYNLCYKIIIESRELEGDFKYLCENLVALPQERTIKIDAYISTEEREFIVKIYSNRIEGILSEVINKVNYGILDQNIFYSELYKNLMENFSDKKELAVAFELILRDSRIPFVFLGKPLTMNKEDYKEYIEKNEENINKLIYILRMNFSQKTEESSVLLNFIDSIEDYKDKVVVFAQLIDVLKRGGMAGILKDLIMREKSEDTDEK